MWLVDTEQCIQTIYSVTYSGENSPIFKLETSTK